MTTTDAASTLTTWAILLAIPTATLAAYIALCRWRPYKRCRHCHGQGQTAHTTKPATARNLIAATGLISPRTIMRIIPCTRCHASGYRRRFGRVLADTWRWLNRPHQPEEQR